MKKQESDNKDMKNKYKVVSHKNLSPPQGFGCV